MILRLRLLLQLVVHVSSAMRRGKLAGVLVELLDLTGSFFILTASLKPLNKLKYLCERVCVCSSTPFPSTLFLFSRFLRTPPSHPLSVFLPSSIPPRFITRRSPHHSPPLRLLHFPLRHFIRCSPSMILPQLREREKSTPSSPAFVSSLQTFPRVAIGCREHSL